ncbi:MAG: Hpt domain-containing protein, partial [Candidatus Dormibacteraeota bacterium]|nr:Hpt domain-containing protein [Candidatus Dormibacteraeota bacterium]
MLALESAPGDRSAIDGILREAHTMKGAAGMVGMMRVSRLAHRLEDLLVELRAGTRLSTPELTDSMLMVVDGLGRLIFSPSSADQDASDEAAMERLLPASQASPPPVQDSGAAISAVVLPAPAPAPAPAPPPAVAVAGPPIRVPAPDVSLGHVEAATLEVPV